jgi:hypothetical protein
MSTSRELLAKAQATIDWYWQHGTRRRNEYEVPPGTWLDSVYQCRNKALGLIAAENTPKPCLALWGPSQTGKSTLLSGYLDHPDDDKGHHSALKWSDAEPVRFVIGRDKSPDVTVLNPFNFKADASGCVSRFTMRDSVPDPGHPVEVILATDAQILHALAAGYLSECEQFNAKGEKTSWDSDSFTTLLGKFKPTGQTQPATFEFLQQFAETLDLLITSDHSNRYTNLKTNWVKSLRPRMLECPGLLSNIEQVRAFAYEILWDSWPSLTQIYEALSARRSGIITQWGTSSIRCSYRVASILLDIDSYKKCEQMETERKVAGLNVSVSNGVAAINHQGSGTPLARNKDEFGLFQGLVWELHFPLNRAVLEQRWPVVAKFFETADLMDFPGVANSYGNAKRHGNEDVAKSPLIALTEVLKRGKTASIVVTRARAMDIDGFSLLMRLGHFPAQPTQLVAGISSWLEAFGHPSRPPTGKHMPINLVMTFCASLVNMVVQSGPRQGLQPCFDQLKALDWLAKPQIVNAVATNYAQFTDGHIHGSDTDKQTALKSILSDNAFHERFGDSAESFREMFANGGTDYFFRLLTVQAQQSQRKQILSQQLSSVRTRLEQLITERLPGEVAAAEERNRTLDEWRGGIHARLQIPPAHEHDLDPATKVSARLRRFLNIDPDELDDIPANAVKTRLPVRSFLEKQFRSWQTQRSGWPNLQELGMKDSTHGKRILSYLIDAVDYAPIETFFRENLGHITSRVDSKQCRRYLAAQMSNGLLRSPGTEPLHKDIDSVRELLNQLAEAEDTQTFSPETSPHYITVISPLLARLEFIKKNSGAKGRPAQPGDAELSQIAKLP